MASIVQDRGFMHQFRYFLLMNSYCHGSMIHEVLLSGGTTIEFGVRIEGRKNLNWCTPFFAVSLRYCPSGLDALFNAQYIINI